MVASDGGVFAFNASFAGSCPAIGGCSGPAVAVAPDASGNGYWLATATGNVYTFGDAPYSRCARPAELGDHLHGAHAQTEGGTGSLTLTARSSPTATLPTWGALPGPREPRTPPPQSLRPQTGMGYRVASANGSVFTYGDAANDGSMAGTHLNGAIIAGTGF